MTTTPGWQPLADIDSDAADVWHEFACDNHVSVDSLIEALGPILATEAPTGQSFSSALTQAVEQARMTAIVLS